MSHKNAILALADGTVFHGQGFGAEGFRVGEVVFNTAMTGYQEILTDPSYADQIVVLTYPHIGNTGCNSEDEESGGLQGADLASVVSCESRYAWDQGLWRQTAAAPRYKVVVYDFGVKHNILRELVHLGCELTVVPVSTPVEEVLAMQPDGVMLSNGPGDPEPVANGIAAAKSLMEHKVPVFGICLGHQILALASGAQTLKMKFGHHGANHPVQDLATGQVWISSQNHGFAVDEASLPAHLKATHRSLFDQSLQGIARTDCPAFSFQGHPEASPGPHDVSPLFQRFIEMMDASA